MKSLRMLGYGLVTLVIVGCGGGSDSADEVSLGANEYLLNVEAELTYWSVPAAKVAAIDAQPRQVMLGTMIVEVTLNAQEEIGVTFRNLDLRPQDNTGPQIQLTLSPDSTSSGRIYKLCDILLIPLGTSFMDLHLAAVSQSSDVTLIASGSNVMASDGESLLLGQLTATADPNDRTSLPVLGDIPILRFMFNGQEHRARPSNLIIMLTPPIVSLTE